MTKTIAVLTGGGDCPGLNAVLRAIVRTAIHHYGWRVIGFKKGYRGLVENDYIEFNSTSVSGILDRGGTILGTSNKHDPFNYADGDSYVDKSDQAMTNLAALGAETLILIGGDGTMISADDFRKKGLQVVGVPKTIDNDLLGTDFSFGFQTAVEVATNALDNLHSTAESHHRLMVLEVMGRYAGWIALYAGMAGGADVILMPEIPYSLEKISAAVLFRQKIGRHFSLIVAAEGAIAQDGQMTVNRILTDSPDPIRLGGIGARLADELEAKLNIESRTVMLGHLQRGGRPNPYDRLLSTRFGAAAVEAVADGDFGKMVALQGTEIVRVPLEQVAHKLKLVPQDHELIQVGRKMGVCFGD